MPEVRRHPVYLSDREVTLIERALRAYAAVMQIQTAAPSPREADDNVRAPSHIQTHRNCKCPQPSLEGENLK